MRLRVKKIEGGSNVYGLRCWLDGSCSRAWVMRLEEYLGNGLR